MARAQKPHKKPKVSIGSHPRWVLLLVGLGLGLYTFLSLVKHARFETYMYDLGLVDQVLWKASRFYIPQSTVTNLPPLFWSHHLDLTFYLQVPFYWLWNDVRMYLFLEVLIAVLGVFPLYLFAKEKLGRVLALGISFSYLFSLGVQFALDYPGHMDVRLATFLSFLFYFLFKGDHKLVYATAVVCLLTKESAAFYLVFVGLFAIFFLKEKRLGTVLIAFSLLFLALVSFYLFSPLCPFPSWYKGLSILKFFRRLVFPPVKLKTLFWLLFSFGFLPLLSPFLLVSLPMFLERFLAVRPELWGLPLHYNILTVPVFAYSLVFGLERLKRKIFVTSLPRYLVILLSCYLVGCSLMVTFLLRAPLTRLFDPKFYQFPLFLEATRKMIKKVPQYASLEAQEDLFPHFSHRDKIYPLGRGGGAEFIALDVNLFAASKGGKDKYIKKLLEDPNFGLVFCREGAVLFERGKKDRVELCPKVREFVKVSD